MISDVGKNKQIRAGVESNHFIGSWDVNIHFFGI